MAFAPILYLSNIADTIAFYEKAFDAKELRRCSKYLSANRSGFSAKVSPEYLHGLITRNNN